MQRFVASDMQLLDGVHSSEVAAGVRQIERLPLRSQGYVLGVLLSNRTIEGLVMNVGYTHPRRVIYSRLGSRQGPAAIAQGVQLLHSNR